MIIRKLILAGALSSGLLLTATGAAFASASHPASAAKTAPAAHVKAAEPGGESANSGEQEGSTPGDGPGGHADPAGQTVDHQFTGVE